MPHLITQNGHKSHIVGWRKTHTDFGLAYGRVVLVAKCSSAIYAREDGLGAWKLTEVESNSEATCRRCLRRAKLPLPVKEASPEDEAMLARWEAGTQ